MAYKKYRFALVSEEVYGAARPNIVEAMLDDATSDADALTFGTNLALIFGADVVTIDKELATNYGLPYPAGTNSEWRFAFRDGSGNLQTERLYDIVAAPATPRDTALALIAAGFKVYPFATALTSLQVAVFDPSASA